jgi:hypothetical protein
MAVSIEPDREAVRRGAQRMGITMPIAISENETLGPLAVNQVPSTVFVNEKGVIVAAASGVRSQGFFDKRARALLPP